MDPWLLLIISGIAAAVWIPMRLSRVDPLKAEQLVARGAELVDVRSAGEYAAGHLPGARLAPLQQLLSDPKQLGDSQAEWVVYCASGARSALAVRALRRAGFRHVYDLGSLSRWPRRARTAASSAERPEGGLDASPVEQAEWPGAVAPEPQGPPAAPLS